jgi:L-aspartate oxidase
MVAALRLRPRHCILLSAGRLGDIRSSALAQGGIAAALSRNDGYELHCQDTLHAGAGLCDEGAVLNIVKAGPGAISLLEDEGVRFDRDADERLVLGLEAAHSRNRIAHVNGDGTGREIVEVLARRVREAANIFVLEHATVTDIIMHDGSASGVAFRQHGKPSTLSTGRVVIATGGIGGLFLHTTNPPTSIGQGLALAARAGAVLCDLEFIQFHPWIPCVLAWPMRFSITLRFGSMP